MKNIFLFLLTAIIIASCSKKRDCEYTAYGLYFHSSLRSGEKITSKPYWYFKRKEVDWDVIHKTIENRAEKNERWYTTGDNLYPRHYEYGVMSCYQLKKEMETNGNIY